MLGRFLSRLCASQAEEWKRERTAMLARLETAETAVRGLQGERDRAVEMLGQLQAAPTHRTHPEQEGDEPLLGFLVYLTV